MPEFGQNIDAQRRRGVVEANAAIGEARRAYITAVPGQEMIYQAKEVEARTYLSGIGPEDISAYPMIAAEIGITAPTAWHLSVIWLYMGDLWRNAAASLENIRLRTIAKIEAAKSVDEINAVLGVMRDEINARRSSSFTDRPTDWFEDHGDYFVTRCPLAWDIGRKGGPRVTIPAGYRFDVSIPRWLWWAASPRDRRYLGAAAVHDWLLADGWDVWTAGAQFRAALEADGVPFLRRLLMTLATIAFARPA